MKLRALRRLEIGKTVGKYRQFEADDVTAARLIENGDAVSVAAKRDIVYPPYPRDPESPRYHAEMAAYKTAMKNLRNEIGDELACIVYDNFMIYYNSTDPAASRATRVATAQHLMRDDLYPFVGKPKWAEKNSTTPCAILRRSFSSITSRLSRCTISMTRPERRSKSASGMRIEVKR